MMVEILSFKDIQLLPRGRGTVLQLHEKEYYKQVVYARGESLWRCFIM